jgi:hypothetical protein
MAEIRKKSDHLSSGDEVIVKIVNQMVFVRNEEPIVDPDDPSGRTFTVNYDYVSDTLCVSLNGMRQNPGITNDFEEKGSKKFRFNYTIMEDDQVIVDYIKIMGV